MAQFAYTRLGFERKGRERREAQSHEESIWASKATQEGGENVEEGRWRVLSALSLFANDPQAGLQFVKMHNKARFIPGAVLFRQKRDAFAHVCVIYYKKEIPTVSLLAIIDIILGFLIPILWRPFKRS